MQLDSEYSTTVDVNMQLLYSKLAVLEFSGWIEVSMDTVCKDYISRKIVLSDNINRINKIVDKHYGFSYDDNVYPMMCSVLGINNWENILDTFSTLDKSNFLAVLGTYKNLRNRAAHTNTVHGVTPTFMTPSAVIVDFGKIKPAFQHLESKLKSL